MRQSTEWSKGVEAQHSITRAARQLLRERFKAVWHYAPLAATKWEQDIEHVHQLRVATRRAQAALQLFSDLLPQRQTRWMRRRLRELRTAAGNARDLDVLAQRLRCTLKAPEGRHLRPILKHVVTLRRKASKPLAASYNKAKSDGFKRRSRAIAKAIRWKHKGQEPTFAEVARVKLAPLVYNFRTASAADLSDVKTLHQMRISGKRVRYAMELLAGAFDESSFRDLHLIFSEVQEKLGAINDHANAITKFNEWLERASNNRSQAALAELIAQEKLQLDAECKRFFDWWTADRAQDLSNSLWVFR